MPFITLMIKLRIKLATALLLGAVAACGQAPPQSDAPAEKPLPEIAALLRQVFANEQASTALERKYIFRQHTKRDELSSRNVVKKTDTEDHEIFWINDLQIDRLLARDGHALPPDEAREESRRIDGEVKKAARHTAKPAPQQADLTLQRMLEIGDFSNEHRILVNGRDVIVVDFLGNRKAKTHNEVEAMLREMAATFWIDEKELAIERLAANFDHDFKLGAGLLLSVSKGSKVDMSFQKINGEIWLPYMFEAYGHLRLLMLFGVNGYLQETFSNYRKFQATSTILPGVTTIESTPAPTPP